MAEHAQLPVELVADPLGAPPCRLTASRTAAGKSQALVKSSLSQSLRALAALTQLPTPMGRFKELHACLGRLVCPLMLTAADGNCQPTCLAPLLLV